MRTLIKNATIVNEGSIKHASLVIEDDIIKEICEEDMLPVVSVDEVTDATGCYVLPGVIDDHVHFREPGMTDKADIASESRAAAAGGVTSYFDMPNTVPQTTTIEAWRDKMERGAKDSVVNYAFFIGATNDNAGILNSIDCHAVPGIKLFMGSSTGNMLVDRREALERVFRIPGMPVMTHCEDTAVINANMAEAKAKYGDDPDVVHHPEIRSEEACWRSTSLAVEMARKCGARLHVAHVSTARELQLFTPNDPQITAEATSAHIFFSEEDYKIKGTKIKVNPAIKTKADREEIRRAMADGRISVVGTDHAPHLLAQKQGGCAKAASGMPMVQFSLPAMLSLVDEGVLTITRVVELMSHNPARIFEVAQRGYIRKGYKADLVMVRPDSQWTVTLEGILSKCGWSPMEGCTFNWRVERTWCNGHLVYAEGRVDDTVRGEAIRFRE
ncbi:MAG: dihydroorotase [Prevotellaceae bacterium]|nr:dihydroorotase [Prevotellaceae bacterium]